MFILAKRIIKTGWQNFWRDGEIAIATIFILVITTTFVTFLFLLKDFSQFLIYSLEEKADISVYFKEGVLEEEIFSLKERLSQMSPIKDVKYVSKIQALEEFVKRYKEDKILMESLEEVGGNPFLASLNIKAREASQYEKIVSFLEAPDFQKLIAKIDYRERKSVIEKIFSLASGMEKSGIIIVSIFVLVSILVVFNTIRLAILKQKEEIKIQRLVGASNWFIRGPFIVEGIIAGSFAALTSLLIFFLICWFLSPKLEFFSPGFNLWQVFIKNLFVIILLQLSTGILLGTVSSSIAIRKYLKI